VATIWLGLLRIELIQVSMPRYDIERFGAAPKLNAGQTFGTGTKIKKTLTALRGRWPRPLLEKIASSSTEDRTRL